MSTAVELNAASVPLEGCGGGGRKHKCECNSPPNPDSDENEMVSSDDDDDDEYVKELRSYLRQVRETGGFHVDKRPPGSTLVGGIIPLEIEDKDLFQRVRKFTQIAIEDYNTTQNANLEFERIVKANGEGVRGTRYYITFVAKDSSGEKRNYQALVWDGIWEHKVKFCRPEPVKQGDPKKSRPHVPHGV